MNKEKIESLLKCVFKKKKKKKHYLLYSDVYKVNAPHQLKTWFQLNCEIKLAYG